MINAQAVQVNEKAVPAKYVIRNGDCIQYFTQDRVEPLVNKKVQIIYEDKELLVVNKSAPIPVHPVGKYLENTLINLVKKIRLDDKIFLAHRLDRETTGICILTKSNRAKESLYEQFANGQVKKKYLALCWGWPKSDEGLIDLPIGKVNPASPESPIRIKQIPNGMDSKRAQTQYKVLHKGSFVHKEWRPPNWSRIKEIKEESPDLFNPGSWPLSLIECQPLTGRTNQIRVHLASLKSGIIGDKLYDPNDKIWLELVDQAPVLDDGIEKNAGPLLSKKMKSRLVFRNHALHASRIEFKHPRDGRKISLFAPPPRVWADKFPFLKSFQQNRRHY